jgi:HEAT repeat protein/predicted XRE-type DNA-binding protein
MKNTADLRAQCQQLIASKALKQADLARLADIAPSQMSKFLNGFELSASNLAKLETAVFSMDDKPVLSNELTQFFARKLRDKQLILFVGAGLSHLAPFNAPRTAPLPLWQGLAQEIGELFVEDGLNVQDYTNVTNFFDAASATDPAKLEIGLRDVLNESYVTPSRNHELIAKLPWSQVWTTNYDKLLERAMGRVCVNGETEFTQIRELVRLKREYVLHLHGTLDRIDSLTLGRDSYREWSRTHPQVQNFMQAQMLANTVLFIGYGMGDPNIDEIQTWLRLVKNDPVLVSSMGKQGSPIDAYGLFWKMNAGELILLEKRDKVKAVSISSEAQLHSALQGIKLAYDKLMSPVDPTPTGVNIVQNASAEEPSRKRKTAMPSNAVASNDASARYSFAAVMREQWNDSGVSAWAIPGPRYASNQVTLDDVFVESSVSKVGDTFKPLTDFGIDDELDEDGDAYSAENPENRKQSKHGKKTDSAISSAKEDHDALERTLSKPQTIHLPAVQALTAQPYSVLVGAPGSGKSLLLRHIARNAASAWLLRPQSDPQSSTAPLPFYFKLNAWQPDAQALPADTALLKQLESHIVHHANVSLEQAQAWVKQPMPVLWLLDGLDEVRGAVQRQRLLDGIAALARSRNQDRFVISVRPSGYQQSLGGQWVDFELQPLSDTQVLQMLEKWQIIVEKNNDLPINAQQLNTDLLQNNALGQLRRNPLLLTLAVLFYRASHRLPNDRWEFYTRADENLRVVLARLRVSQNMDVESYAQHWGTILGIVALHGMVDNTVRFSRRTLEDIVCAYYVSQQYTAREAVTEANIFIEAADNILGVIVAFAPEEYGFLHLTFQEFHAAKALLQHPEQAQLIAENWDNPDWAELWQLYLLGAKATGQMTAATALLQGALGNPHALDSQLCRPQLAVLGWAGLVGGPIFETAAWEEVWAWFEDLELEHLCFESAHREIEKWIVKAPELIISHLLIEMQSRVWATRRIAIYSLASQTWQEKVFSALLAIMQDNSWRVRDAAITALATQASQAEVLDVLLLAMQDTNSNIRIAANDVLCAQAGELTVQKKLLLAVQSTDWQVRRAAINGLSTQSRSKTVLETMLSAMRDKDWHVRRAAVKALASEAGQPIVCSALLRAIQDTNTFVSRVAVTALSSQTGKSDVLDTLMAEVQNNDSFVRRAAISAVANQANQTKVLKSLLVAIQDQDWQFRDAATEALASQAEQLVVLKALLNAMQDPDSDVRCSAINALSMQSERTSVLEALLRAIEDDEWQVRRCAVTALAAHSEKTIVLNALLEAIKDKHWRVRDAAIAALATQALKPKITNILLSALQDKSPSTRIAAINALEPLLDQSTVRNALQTAINNTKWDVRDAAAAALSKQAQIDRKASFRKAVGRSADCS